MRILLLLLMFNVLGQAEHAMNFYVKPPYRESVIVKDYLHRGQRVIYADGVIEAGTVKKFKEYVYRNNIQKGFVFLNSEGGSLLEGIALGQAIRDYGFDTTIGYIDSNGNNRYSGICASACAYAFAGGVGRYIYSDEQHLGVHQFFNGKGENVGDVGVVQSISAVVADYLLRMGIDPKVYVLASSVGSNDMRWLSKREALQLNFANNGKNTTTAEIKANKTNIEPAKPIKQQTSHKDMQKNIEDHSPKRISVLDHYVVKSGDTLYLIAKKFNGSRQLKRLFSEDFQQQFV